MCVDRYALRNAEGGIKAMRIAQLCLKSWRRLSSFFMYTYCSSKSYCVIPRFIVGLIQTQKLPVNGSVTSIINQEAVLLWGKNARQ